MKKIKKILIFVLCAFAVLFTVGFSNVNAAVSGTKINGLSSLVDGNYLIACKSGNNNYFLGNDTSGKNPKANAITITEGAIEAVPTNAIWTFSKLTNGKWNIQSGDNFLNMYDNSQGVVINNRKVELEKHPERAEQYEWIITETTSGYKFSTPKSGNRFITLYDNKDFRGRSSGTQNFEIYKCEDLVGKISVNFNTNGGSNVPTLNILPNTSINRPSDPVKDKYKFVNWYTTETFDEGTEFDFNSTISQEITLYAKWEKTSYFNFMDQETKSSLNISYIPKTIELNGIQYNKVSATKEDWTGTYFIVYEDKGKAYIFNGLDQENGYKLSDITENSVLVDSTYDNCKVEIAKMEGGYSLKTTSGYIYGTSGNNGLKYNENTQKLNTLTYKTDGHVEIKSDNTYFSFNAASNQMRFRYYKNTGQNAVYLYEMGEQVTKTVESYEVSNISLRFGIMVPVADYDAMVAEGAKFGVTLQKGTNAEQTFECAPVRVNEKGVEDAQGNFYQFAVVLTNVPSTDYAVSVTGKCYVEINGVKHYMVEKTTSVKATAQDYLNLTDKTAIEAHLGALTELAK